MKKIGVFLLVLFSWIGVQAQQNPIVASQPYKFMKWVSIQDSLILQNARLGNFVGHLTLKSNGTVGLDTVNYAPGTITFSTDFTYISGIVGMNFDTMFNQKQNFYFKANGFQTKFDSLQATSIRLTRLGLGNSTGDGLRLENTQASTNVVNQSSPGIFLNGTSWLDSTSTSQVVKYRIWNNTLTGATAGAANLTIDREFGTNGWGNLFTLGAQGFATFVQSITEQNGHFTKSGLSDGSGSIAYADQNNVNLLATANNQILTGYYGNSTYNDGSKLATVNTIVGGSGYTNGTYTNVTLNDGNQHTLNATGTVVVSGNAVTSVTVTNGGNRYTVGNTLTFLASQVGGTGSGASCKVATVTNFTGVKHRQFYGLDTSESVHFQVSGTASLPNDVLTVKDSSIYGSSVTVNNGLTKTGGVIQLGGLLGQSPFTSDRFVSLGNQVFGISGGTASGDTSINAFSKNQTSFVLNNASGNQASLTLSSADPSVSIGINQAGQVTSINLTTTGIPVRDDFGAGMGYPTGTTYETLGMAVFGDEWIPYAGWVNAQIAAGSGHTTNALSLTYGFTGQPLSFNGSAPITGKIDSTVLQTVLNFFPKGDTRYAKISSLPSGANPTASIGFTAVNGSNTSFTRSDGAPKADSTVIRSVANSYSLAGMQTKLNNYALLASPTFTGTPLAPTASFGTNTTQIATTAFVQAAIPSLTGFVPYTGATTDVILGSHNLSAQTLIATGASGLGYLDLTSQVSPTSTTNHLKIYSDSLNRLSWKNSTFRRTIRVTRSTDQTIQMPFRLNPIVADSTDVASTYAFQTTAINNGYAITGGGNLSASRTLAVDSTLQASKTWAFAAFNTKAQDASTYVPLTRTLTAGTGILTIGDLSANRTISADTTVLQTVLNFFPKGDTRWLKTSTAAATYLPLTGGTITNSTAPQLTIAFDGTHTSQFSVNASGMLTIANTSGSISLQTVLSNTLRNIASANNAQISLGATGIVASNADNDANAAFVINKSNASATGDILDLQFNSINAVTFGKSGEETITQNGLNTTPTTSLLVQNTTAALVSQNQYSGWLEFDANGWKTNATAASQLVQAQWGLQTATGAANPSGTMVLGFLSNGSATTGIFSFTSAGVSSFTGGTMTNKLFNTGANNVDGYISTTTTASTAGTTSNWAPTVTLTGTVWNTTATAASNVMSMRMGLKGVSGTAPSSIATWNFGTGVSTPSYSGTNAMELTSGGALSLPIVGSELKIGEGSGGFVGQTTLVSGTKAITVTGVTTSSRALVTLVNQSGTTTTTTAYEAVCTSNTLTISAVTNAGINTINTLDTSSLNYFIIN